MGLYRTLNGIILSTTMNWQQLHCSKEKEQRKGWTWEWEWQVKWETLIMTGIDGCKESKLVSHLNLFERSTLCRVHSFTLQRCLAFNLMTLHSSITSVTSQIVELMFRHFVFCVPVLKIIATQMKIVLQFSNIGTEYDWRDNRWRRHRWWRSLWL